MQTTECKQIQMGQGVYASYDVYDLNCRLGLAAPK
jgi:hypothetical protein